MTKLKRITAGLIVSVTMLGIAPLAAHAEWRQDSNGWWYSNGASYATKWSKIDGQWYYFDDNGYMKTGWVNDNGNWYYFNGDGTMAHDTTIDGNYLNSNGNISSNQSSLSFGAYSCH